MSDKTYVLSLSADTFNAFKMDFDSALQRLLQKMDRLQSDSASINCKISVALTPAPERNFDATQEGDTVQVMKPSFSHEISTEIKVKDKTTGNLSGNRKLVWDEELMEYVMKDIDDGQTSLFDTAQSRQNAAPPVEQEPPQLPEGIVDVDYTVISDDKGYILRNPDKCGIKDQWGILKVLVGERMTVATAMRRPQTASSPSALPTSQKTPAMWMTAFWSLIWQRKSPATASARFRSATMRSRKRSW